MSKNRRGRQKGMNRSKLRHYNSDIVHVTQQADKYVLRQYMKRMDSVKRALHSPHYVREPERRQLQVDYFPQPTPAKTEPMSARDRLMARIKADDFIDGIDEYHALRVDNGQMPTLSVHLMFHADHCFFVMKDHIKNAKWMSHDFNDRKRALYAFRAGLRLTWKEIV